jgi:hypothetical protein
MIMTITDRGPKLLHHEIKKGQSEKDLILRWKKKKEGEGAQ